MKNTAAKNRLLFRHGSCDILIVVSIGLLINQIKMTATNAPQNLFYCARDFGFGVAGGAPGGFFEGGFKVGGVGVFVKEAGVKAVSTGGSVYRGDFFGRAFDDGSLVCRKSGF